MLPSALMRLLIFSLSVPAVLLLSGCPQKAATVEKGGKKGAGGPVPVATALVSQRDVPVEIQIIGNVEAYSTVTVKAQVTGILQKVYFQEGDMVKKGQKLFSIDPSPFQAAVSQMEANVARDRAILEQAKANLNRDMAQQKYQASQAARYAQLFKEGVFSKDQAEQVQANADTIGQSVKADQAAIASAQASVLAGEAAVRNAKISLDYTTISSPVDGRTGNLIAKEGNLASANTTELIVINQVQPVYVTFSLPESQFPQVKEAMARGKLPVNAIPPEDGGEREVGLLSFVDNRVDPNTGTIRLKGTFDNARRRLWPGQFVRVSLRLSVRQAALLVPNQAVQTGQDGPYVYRIRDNRAQVVKVTTGPRVDQDLVIEIGLDSGDIVVTEGQLRLSDNAPVRMRGESGGDGKVGGKRGKQRAE
ncbi:MAG: efflux RND transporter periplasmic adaptor subunit [Acidobacteria bacterium]|nr:efflux RND transporter periplasmic adaptor subunit [Acidobacteriota bacterium]